MILELEKYSSHYARKDYEGKNEIRERFTVGDLSSWMNLSYYVSGEEVEKVLSISDKVRASCDVFVVIGIGGSYMGSKAVIEALSPYYERSKPEIIFIGTDLDAKYYEETLEYLKKKEFFVNVISKSGNTLEPSLAFDLVRQLAEEKYGDKARDRIIVTTDAQNGSLRNLVNEKHYESLVVPSQVGGRFSVFTVVGLLPIAVAGVDIKELLRGASDGMKQLEEAFDYSYRRKDFEALGKTVESFTIYESRFIYLAEWLRQLFGETQGKEAKGLLPVYNLNSRDLHSLGQFLQEGRKQVFETVISVSQEHSLFIDRYAKTLSRINYLVSEAVAMSHEIGNTPSIFIEIKKLDAYNLAKLMQWFIYASIIGALIDGVNPFDQPGVEEYKKMVTSKLESN